MSNKGPAFEQLNIGDEIPRLVVGPVTIQDLVEWCGAEEDYLNIHYDEAAAKAAGLPGCIIQGTFKCGMLGRMVTDWLGESGTLRRISVSYRGMDFPGDTITCRGKVTNSYIKDSESRIELELWTENQRGQKTTQGIAVVTVP
jgi:acyl dehydratase